MNEQPLHTLADQGWRFNQRLNLTSLPLSNRAAVQQFLKGRNISGRNIFSIGI